MFVSVENWTEFLLLPYLFYSFIIGNRKFDKFSIISCATLFGNLKMIYFEKVSESCRNDNWQPHATTIFDLTL